MARGRQGAGGPMTQGVNDPDLTFAQRASSERWPAIGELKPNADAGALLSYSPDLAEMWRRTAEYVDKIARGANPADLPVEHPNTFGLVVNLKTAKVIGLTMPPILLVRADELLE